ncbi:hypothetical protein OHA40_17125 [Nocardia sp. NBC_00508]|uniref:hypothetical protein n=1 Tax=Nocardia sp. NBC_00508 TaxID=2975992 RepID=UPI002E81162B|nr:hypothetical protein [Nocardia sp. NBC_00508]WUD63517.1 hypothetical protein OHA40_17125 [Nocardia sp. NBC_00508]
MIVLAAVLGAIVAVVFLIAWLLTGVPATGPRVSEIDERLSHEAPIRPLTVEQANQQWPRHLGCRLGYCSRKQAILHTLRAAGATPDIDATPDSCLEPTRRGGRHAHRRRKP